MVNAEDNDDLLQTADNQTADKLNAQERLNRAEDDLLKTVHDRTDNEEAESHRDGQSQERSDDQVDHVGNESFEPMLKFGRKYAENECR